MIPKEKVFKDKHLFVLAQGVELITLGFRARQYAVMSSSI